MSESDSVFLSDTVTAMGMGIAPTATGMDMGIHTVTTAIGRWFTWDLGITGITGIIVAAVTAATFGITAFTGGKSKTV